MQEIQKWLCVGQLSGEKMRRVNLQFVCKSSAQSNNAMPRPRVSVPLIENLRGFEVECAAADGGR